MALAAQDNVSLQVGMIGFASVHGFRADIPLTMPTLELIDRVEVLPRDCAVGIYGAGGRGSLLMHILRQRRPDVRVQCFFDDFKSGEVSGIPILRYASQRQQVPMDWLLVASLAAADIIPRLREDERYCLTNIAQFDGHFANDYYDATDWRLAEGPLAATRAMLADEDSRELLDQIVAARRRQPSELANRFAHTLWQRRQYLEHLVAEPIRGMIDGGVFDGATALTFLRALPNLKRIIGFEPVEKFLQASPHRPELEASRKFTWIQAALSDTEGRAQIVVDDRNPSAARFADAGKGDSERETGRESASEDQGSWVRTVTLDQFLAEQPSSLDFIKYDLEGADFAALKGARQTIRSQRPQLAISIYHSKEDLYRIPLWLRDNLEGYVYRLGHYSPDIYETVLYGTPSERLT